MIRLPLILESGHLFVENGNERLLLDTGAPRSFHASGTVNLEGAQFSVPQDYVGLSSDTLSEFVSVEVAGLIGVDILNRFDIILDVPSSTIIFSKNELHVEGTRVPLTDLMGIPICEVSIGALSTPAFFDTGAQVSYFEPEAIKDLPSAGNLIDFYPGIGKFSVETFRVNLELANVPIALRGAVLPDALETLLLMASVRNIIGNEIAHDRPIGYFPRRNYLAI